MDCYLLCEKCSKAVDNLLYNVNVVPYGTVINVKMSQI